MLETNKKAFKIIAFPEAIRKVVAFSKKGVIRNVFWLSFDKVFRLLLSLVVGSAVARYLGPIQWGKINFVLAFVSILVPIVTLGLDNFIIKEILENQEKKNKYLGTVFFIRAILAFFAFFCVVAIFYFQQLSSEYYFIFFALFLSILVTPFDLIDLEYQLNLESKKSVKAKSVAYIISSFCKILAVYLKMPVTVFAAILGFESVLAACLLIRNYQKKSGGVKVWTFDKSIMRHVFKNAFPFLLAGLSVILYMRLDQIMLGNLLTIGKVGEFSAAVRVTEIFLFIPVAISGSFYSALITSKKQDMNLYKHKLQVLFNVMFIISFSLALGVTLFSNIIINILYGSRFEEAAAILRVHVWSLMAIFLGVASSQYLVIENLQKINFYNPVIGFSINVTLNIFFIPRWGALGSAYATLASYWVSGVFSNLLFKKSRVIVKYQLNSFFSILTFRFRDSHKVNPVG